jgi:hypothetical protein
MSVNIIRHNAPAIMTVTLTTVLAGGLAACGTPASSSSSRAIPPGSGPTGASTGIPASSGDPLAGLSAEAIATQALANTKAAVSVRISGSGTDSGKPLTFSITLVKGKGCTGTMSEGAAGSLTLVEIGTTLWIKPTDAFWKGNTPVDPATLRILSGKYIHVKAGSGLGAVSSLCNLGAMFSNAANQLKGMVKGTPATVNGQPSLQLKDTGDAVSLFVSDTATPVFVRVVDPSSGGGTIDFTDYGAVTTITAPPASQILEGGKYGF